jgi:hypothetical protein
LLPDVPDADRDTRLGWEKELLGLYISDHPLLPLREYLEQNTVHLERLSEDRSFNDGSAVTVGGMVTTVKKMIDKNGRTWAAFTIEDLTGSIEVLCFSKTYEKCGHCVEEDAKLLVAGRLAADNRRGGGNNRTQAAGDDDDNSMQEAEATVYKIMADEIQVIPNDAAATVASDYAATSVPVEASGVAANGATNGVADYAANGSGHANGAALVNGGISVNRNGSYANGSNGSNGHGANGNGANGNGANGANGYHGANGNGANGANGNGANGHAVDVPRSKEPAQIGRVFSPPPWAYNCVHLHISEENASADILGRLWNICRSHQGETEVWLHIDNGVEMMQLRVAPDYWVTPTPDFRNEVLRVLSEECLMVPETS